MIPGSEWFVRIVEALTRRYRYHGAYPYQVQGEANGQPSLTAVGAYDGLPASINPDELYIPKAHGLPGASSSLATGTQVLLSFEGGDPARPYVAAYLPKQPLPVSVTLDAETAINVGTGSATVNVGGSGGNKAADGLKTDEAIQALLLSINLIALHVGLGPTSSPASVQATKVTVV